jgi:23S rRNA (adenine2503-C2)-methyltransferase
MKPRITDIALGDLEGVVTELGMKRFVADQLVRWLYKQRVRSFDEMTNIQSGAREKLAEEFDIGALELVESLVDDDGTSKYCFKLHDGERVETVLIPSGDDRRTLCVSTQVGCKMGCDFCRTGEAGFKRNLTQGEIVGQAVEVQRTNEKAITNIVFMGMGEPMFNMDAVLRAIEILLDERAFGISKRKITVSTAGLVPELKEFVKRSDVKIAISLNAVNDELRSKLMPVNRRYAIAEIMDFCREYTKRAKNRITFEYVMMDRVNDALEDASQLVSLLKGIKAKVNLIPFNAFPGSAYKPSPMERIEAWRDLLVSKGIQANIRTSRGKNILAACGQLANRK